MQTKELKLLLSILLSEASNQRGIFSNATKVYILKSVRCHQLAVSFENARLLLLLMQVIRLLLNHMLDFRTLGMILELWIRPHFKVLLSNSLETLTIFHQSNYVKTQARMARM